MSDVINQSVFIIDNTHGNARQPPPNLNTTHFTMHNN